MCDVACTAIVAGPILGASIMLAVALLILVILSEI